MLRSLYVIAARNRSAPRFMMPRSPSRRILARSRAVTPAGLMSTMLDLLQALHVDPLLRAAGSQLEREEALA
jgi:hypothetical protein